MTENAMSELQGMFSAHQQEEMSLNDYLYSCRKDPKMYAGIAERMVAAIGEPELVDTSKDPRLSRVFLNRTIRVYKPFADFYGMEETIESIAGFFKAAAQELEEQKQILYLLGPVGGGKSSLATRLMSLAEQEAIYVLKAGDQISPVFESPLGLFNREAFGSIMEEKFGIPRRRLRTCMSPWAAKRLREFKGDINRFTVVKMYPSRLQTVCIGRTEPGDENNQDMSTLVGKVDIRKLEQFPQHDVDAYGFSGALNRTTQGIMEFVEMFKAPIKMLHPLITATQDGIYVGTENIGAIPYQGLIVAHSNESEWQKFRGNKDNEAMLDRIYLVKVPYCLRVTEEANIYRKLLRESALISAPCAPGTIELLSQFMVHTRLKEPGNSHLLSKLRAYDGQETKDSDPKAKTVQEYRDEAGVNEGMDGLSTRLAFKILSRTFNFDTSEIAADPVHLMFVIETRIKQEQLGGDLEKKYLTFLKDELRPRFAEEVGKEIQKAYLESYDDYGQNIYDRYVAYADAWLENQDFKHPDTGTLMNKKTLDDELSQIEKPSGISNPKDFRGEVVKWNLRARAKNGGKNPDWKNYERIRDVIEKRMFSKTEEMLPIISFSEKKRDGEMEKKHTDFLQRMLARGYTLMQARRVVEWYMRNKKS